MGASLNIYGPANYAVRTNGSVLNTIRLKIFLVVSTGLHSITIL